MPICNIGYNVNRFPKIVLFALTGTFDNHIQKKFVQVGDFASCDLIFLRIHSEHLQKNGSADRCIGKKNRLPLATSV